MAKINIDFNNETYEIDESALAKAAASLSSHLSTVMNGSGATINLNGVTYNVDSSKLTAATNAFVSHLGTVSGTGSKVVVNGVEYSVDTTKMTKATADLQAVLGDLVSGGGDTPTTGDSITWRTTDVEGREIAYADDGTPVLIKISDLAPTVAELEGAVLSAVDNNTGATETYILSATNGTIADHGSVTALMDNMVIVAHSDGSIIDDDLSIPTKGIWVQLQLTLMDMTVTLTLGNSSDTPETGAHGLYFGKKYNGYAGGDSVSILMSMMFGADGSNTVYSGDGNILANNPAGTVTYEGNAICLNGEPWYIVSEDGVMLISANTNSVGFVLDPSVGITSAVVPDGVTRIGDTNEAPFAYYDILTSITIPASVTSIGGYAFYECTGLTTITFKGTVAQWNAITFEGNDWNYNVPATIVTCSDGTVSL